MPGTTPGGEDTDKRKRAGHAPDIIEICGEAHVLPSSANPTRPFTVNTRDERVLEDLALAEGILHDRGAFSIIASHSQAIGHLGEVLIHSWRSADKMKKQCGGRAEETGDEDNLRVRRYIAKYAINPAIAHGRAGEIGSTEKGKRANLVLWDPAFFGVKPKMTLLGNTIAVAQMSAPTPRHQRPDPNAATGLYAASVRHLRVGGGTFGSHLCERGRPGRRAA